MRTSLNMIPKLGVMCWRQAQPLNDRNRHTIKCVLTLDTTRWKQDALFQTTTLRLKVYEVFQALQQQYTENTPFQKLFSLYNSLTVLLTQTLAWGSAFHKSHYF